MLTKSFRKIRLEHDSLGLSSGKFSGATEHLKRWSCFPGRNRVIFVWLWNENARTKQKQQTNGSRAISLVYRTETNARGFWLVKRTLRWKKLHAWELSRNQSILRSDTILQHKWQIEQRLLHIRVFFGGKTKSSCFDLFLAYKRNNKHLPKHFLRSYENLSIPNGNCVPFPQSHRWYQFQAVSVNDSRFDWYVQRSTRFRAKFYQSWILRTVCPRRGSTGKQPR